MSIEHDTRQQSGMGGNASRTSETMSAAGEEVRHLAEEAKHRATDIMGDARNELSQQMRDKSREAGQALRQMAEGFGHLADGHPEQAGRSLEYVTMAEQRLMQLANRLDYGGPEVLLDDVRRFARRRPVMFLGLAIGAGFSIARMTRAGAMRRHDEPEMTNPYYGHPDLGAMGSHESTSDSGVTGVAV
jgi:hypothetical protein